MPDHALLQVPWDGGAEARVMSCCVVRWSKGKEDARRRQLQNNGRPQNDSNAELKEAKECRGRHSHEGGAAKVREEEAAAEDGTEAGQAGQYDCNYRLAKKEGKDKGDDSLENGKAGTRSGAIRKSNADK